MALALYNRVQETGTANTTVSFTLSGAITGYQSFAVVGNTNTTYYTATDTSGNWEVGVGTYSTTGPTLTRTTILSSSNSGSAVTFSGTVNVWVDYPTEKAVSTDTLASPPAIGATSPSTGKFTTLESTGTASLATGSTTSIQIVGDASYPQVKAVGGTNTPLVLQPLGTGALQAQKTDSTATGGNARGANAVDWQTSRGFAVYVASGGQAVIGGGISNQSSGTISAILGGSGNSATNTYTGVLGGISNTSSGYGASVVGGYTNTAAGYYNFIGNGYTNSATSNSAVTTQSATMNGTTAVTLSGSNASIKVGQLVTGTSINSFPNTYVAAVSGTSLTLSQAASGSSTSTLSFYTPHGVVVGGGNNQATGSYSFIGGGGDAGTSANRNVASGDWSTVGGGLKNVASQIGTFIGGGSNNIASQQYASVVGGDNNNAAAYSASVLGGRYNVANSTYSTTVGGFFGTARGIEGNTAFGACNAPIGFTSGVSQAALLILAIETTNATATVLRSNSSAASGTNQVILPNNSAYYFRGEVVAGVTGGGNTKGWYVEGVIKRGSGVGTTALVGTPTVTSNYADAGASTWALTATADTTNGGLAITFTGQASTTIRVVAQIRTTEMTY
jgi:hypothetical protein